MALMLNDKGSKKYKEFNGRVVDAMHELLKYYRPMSFSDILKERNAVLEGPESVKDAWWNNYFFTGDLAAYNPNGMMKMVLLDDKLMTFYKNRLVPESKLINGALVLTEKEYSGLKGKEFTPEEQEKYGDRTAKTPEQVRKNAMLEYLARSPELLYESAKAASAESKKRGWSGKVMDVWLQSDHYNVPVLRPLVAGSLYYDCLASGNSLFDYFSGRLVGVSRSRGGHAEGARENSVVKDSADLRRFTRYISRLDAGKAFTWNGIKYVPVRDGA